MKKKNILLLCGVVFLAIFLYFVKSEEINVGNFQRWNIERNDFEEKTSRAGGLKGFNAGKMVTPDEQYRRAAEERPLHWLMESVAGSGIAGTRDGVGLYAQFKGPQSLSFGQDSDLLFVLDDAAKNIRKINTRTLQVNTVVSLAKLKAASASHPKLSFNRFAVGTDAFYLLDSSGIYLFRVGTKDISTFETQKAFGLPMHIRDILWHNGRLLALDDANKQICAWNGNEKKWDPPLISFEGTFDRFLIRENFAILTSKDNRTCFQINLNDENEVYQTALEFNPNGILEDVLNQRYIVWSDDQLYTIGYPIIKQSEIKALPFYNIHGQRIGEVKSVYEYDRLPFTPIQDMRLSPEDGRLYIIDSANKRIMKTVLSPHSSLFRNVTSGSVFLNPDYSPRKSQGTNRIFWMSHSVYWDPAGSPPFGDNIYVGGARLVENLLNENPDITWEILNSQTTAIGPNSFYNHGLTILKQGMDAYGFDYTFIVVDLLTYYWLLYDWAKSPPHFDSDQMPNGVDVEMATKDFSQRMYPPKLQPYIHYVKSHPNEFDENTGEMKNYVFYRLWNGDEKFRNIVLDIYGDLATEISRVCERNKIRLYVFVAPTMNFISLKDWTVAGAGGNETSYDFEAMHKPIIEMLWKRGIPAYDLTYDMLWRYPKWFPQNGGITHHNSYLFHQAFAEALITVTNRYGLLPNRPLPEREPIGKAPISVKNNVIYNSEGESCFILHDLSDEKSMSTINDMAHLTVQDYAEMSLEDIRLHQKSNHASSYKTYRVKFVWVKSRDVYGQPVLSNMRPVASLLIQSSYLPQVERVQMELSDTLKKENASDITKKLDALANLVQLTQTDIK